MNEDSPPTLLLISGMMRSGTTLLQRALNAHSAIDVDYQSNTDAFIRLKQEFLAEARLEQYHALAHYNPESGYRYACFFDWANKRDLSQLVVHQRVKAKISGIKEVLVEEFYPLLVARGVLCLNIVRDPRDVIASMSFGDGLPHTGRRRPVLFDLRNWRKSVHFACALASRRGFKQIRFEDLLTDTEVTLKGVFQWLGVSPLGVDEIELNMAARGWAGNSSFGEKVGFDKTALNGYADNLPVGVRQYIEAVCWSEMVHLGYPLTVVPEDRCRIIERYEDPFPVERKEFMEGYSSTVENRRYELKRLKKTFVESQQEIFR